MFSKTSKAENAALTANSSSGIKKGVPSVISGDLHILGNLVSEGLVDVDGSIEGNLKAEQITVRANGKVRGDLVAQVVHVYGEVQGLIRAFSVHLYSSSHVEGVIMHHSLSVEDGAFIDGKFKRFQDKTLDSATESSKDFSDEDGIIDDSSGLSANLRLIS